VKNSARNRKALKSVPGKNLFPDSTQKTISKIVKYKKQSRAMNRYLQEVEQTAPTTTIGTSKNGTEERVATLESQMEFWLQRILNRNHHQRARVVALEAAWRVVCQRIAAMEARIAKMEQQCPSYSALSPSTQHQQQEQQPDKPQDYSMQALEKVVDATIAENVLLRQQLEQLSQQQQYLSDLVRELAFLPPSWF
jgi:translation elongation factor EF-Ts